MNWCFIHNQFVGDGCNGCAKDRSQGIRRAPRKHPNGQWSDGINRPCRIRELPGSVEDPQRIYVWKWDRIWVVEREEPWHDEEISNFEEAIVAADKLARSTR